MNQQQDFKTFPNALILPKVKPLQFQFGWMTWIDESLLFENWDLEQYLPDFESQIWVYFDDYGCVSRSFENALEAVIAKKITTNLFSPDAKRWLVKNLYENEKPNFSDRDLIVISWTKPNVWNDWWTVFSTARKEWIIPQDLADWDFTNRNPLENNLEAYYAYARNEESINKANEFNEKFEIKAEWVARENFSEASKYWALQVYVNAWYKRNWKYYNPNWNHNHAVLLVNPETLEIFDHYEPAIKEIEKIEDIYYWALKINIFEKSMTKPKINNNSLVILVSGSGGIWLYLDDKIIIDDAAKINSVFMARNSKNWFFSGGPVKSLTQEQWNMFTKTNLKWELI